MSKNTRLGIWLALFGTLVLTFDAVLMRLSEMNGLQMTAWRGLCMGAALILFWWLSSRSWRDDLHHIATQAGSTIILCQFFNSLLFCLAIAIAPVAVVLIGLTAVPVFAAVFAWFVIGERTSGATWIAIALVMGGIIVAVTGSPDEAPTGGAALDWSAIGGAVLGLAVAVVLALNFVTLRARPDLPIPLLIGCGALLSGLFSALIIGPAAMGAGMIWAMAATGLVILPVSFLSLSVAARHTQASNVSLLMLLETVLGPLWVWLVIGEAPTGRMILGGGIVVVSLLGYLLLIGRRGGEESEV